MCRMTIINKSDYCGTSKAAIVHPTGIKLLTIRKLV